MIFQDQLDGGIEGVAAQPKTDRLVKIYVAKADTPYLIPRALLQGQSKHFKQQLQQPAGDQSISLNFPDDDATVWKVILYWLVKHKLPAQITKMDGVGDGMSLAIRCWAFGVKYEFLAFHDEVLLWILNVLETRREKRELFCSSDECIEVFQTTEPDSTLRHVFIEEVLREAVGDSGLVLGFSREWNFNALAALEGLGFFKMLGEKHSDDDYPDGNRFDASKCGRGCFWTEYMGGDTAKYESLQYRQFDED